MSTPGKRTHVATRPLAQSAFSTPKLPMNPQGQVFADALEVLGTAFSTSWRRRSRLAACYTCSGSRRRQPLSSPSS